MRKPEPLRIAAAVAKSLGVHSLTTGALQNPKVAKSASVRGVLTLPMHLAPSDSAGHGNTCPHAGACRALCLDGAGNPAYATGKARARAARTALYFNARGSFMLLLVAEIAAHVAAARAARMQPAVRLNATSDILWERIPVSIPRDVAQYVRAQYRVRLAPGDHASIMHAFPRVSFYDYTKIPVQHRARRPANYHLTYSYDPHNAPHVAAAIAAGFNVAVPFAVKRGAALPMFARIGQHELPVIDGDLHDYRPADGVANDGGPVIVGLRFKRITAPAIVARVGNAAASGAGFVLPSSQY
jgi:hypothetical protein